MAKQAGYATVSMTVECKDEAKSFAAFLTGQRGQATSQSAALLEAMKIAREVITARELTSTK